MTITRVRSCRYCGTRLGCATSKRLGQCAQCERRKHLIEQLKGTLSVTNGPSVLYEQFTKEMQLLIRKYETQWEE